MAILRTCHDQLPLRREKNTIVFSFVQVATIVIWIRLAVHLFSFARGPSSRLGVELSRNSLAMFSLLQF